MPSLERESAKLVGKRIAELRHEKGYNQHELADKIDVSRALVAAWESGTRLPDVASWISLAELFGVSCDYISGVSTHRVFKGRSFSDKLDINRLNDLGVDMLFEYYHSLLRREEFLKKDE